MDTLGKLLVDKDFSKCWTHHRNGKIEYYNQTPFLFVPKNHPLVLYVYMNKQYKKNILFPAIKKAIDEKVAFVRLITDDPLKINNSYHEISYTYIIKLEKPLKKIFSSFNDSTKKRIKKAESNNLEFRVVDDDKEFDKWWNKNYLIWIKKKKYTRENYDFVKSSVKNNNFSKLFLAYYQDEIASGLFVLLSPDKKSYIWLSSNDEKFIDKNPDHYLQWKALEWLKKNGYKYCDLGGVEHSKIFKEGFSGKLSTWHKYDFEFDPILKKITFLGYKFKKKIMKKY